VIKEPVTSFQLPVFRFQVSGFGFAFAFGLWLSAFGLQLSAFSLRLYYAINQPPENDVCIYNVPEIKAF